MPFDYCVAPVIQVCCIITGEFFSTVYKSIFFLPITRDIYLLVLLIIILGEIIGW